MIEYNVTSAPSFRKACGLFHNLQQCRGHFTTQQQAKISPNCHYFCVAIDSKPVLCMLVGITPRDFTGERIDANIPLVVGRHDVSHCYITDGDRRTVSALYHNVATFMIRSGAVTSARGKRTFDIIETSIHHNQSVITAIPASNVNWTTISATLLRFGRRLGGVVKPVHQIMRYDGANGAVFDASLMTPSISSVLSPTPRYAVKIIFNVDNMMSKDVQSQHEREFALLRYKSGRCGDCINVVPVYTHFIDTIDIKRLPQLGIPFRHITCILGSFGWDVIDGLLVGDRTMFAVMPCIPFSLKSLLSSRIMHSTDTTKPLLKENEVIHISSQMANGLLYLQSKGIVHRDCKPDNVLIRPSYVNDRLSPAIQPIAAIIQLPSSLLHLLHDYIGWDIAHMNHDHLMSSLIAIADLGEHYDARELQRTDLKMPFIVSGMSRGGAPAYYPPEVALAKPGMTVMIDFGGMDAWALGCCLYEMMATPSSPSLPLPTKSDWFIPPNGLPLSFSPWLRTIVAMLLRPINTRLTLTDATMLLKRQLDLSVPDDPTVLRAPTSQRQCSLCDSIFGTIINRRQHCRFCGFPCCSTCSAVVSVANNTRRLCTWCQHY